MQIDELRNEINMLKNSNSIPIEMDRAFRERFGLNQFSPLSSSAKSSSSENQSVNESGSATYSVLKPPDGFDQRTDGGTVKYYAYWT